ncbi:enolase-phosphatase E1-like isoform X2 [Linepithema humile]|nr:PREDICTED: uncharacterized protein LOC105675678 isoform X2 [Linepithema humile]XP_012228390.1 PREDICTED: uncharacterized protein LOC105675678 isoform X2 [Linepithema humile]
MSEPSSTTSAANKAVSCDEEKHELPEIDKASISGETAGTITQKEEEEKEVTESTALLELKQQQNTCKSDCNGDPEEETNLEKEVSEEIETKTKENNESCSVKTNSNNKETTEYLSQVDQKLSKILQDLHEDLQILQSSNTPATVTDDAEDSSEKEQTIIKDETDLENDMTDSTKESTTSVTAKSTEDKRDSSESSEKTEEKSEVGIVGPPTAVSELINEEELGGDSALSADQKDHVAEWVENWVNPEEEDNVTKGCKQNIYEEKSAADERAKWKKHNDVPSISPRKSQKIVCNIIKRSIKCLNNKMHAMEGAIESKKKVSTAEDNKPPKTSPSSSKVPQNQQNGAALPEETAAASTTAVGHIRTKKETVTKDEMQEDAEMSDTKISKQLLASTSRQKDSSPTDLTQHHAEPVESVKKRKSTEGQLSSFGNRRKKICVDSEREKYISEVVGDESKTIDQLMDKAGQLRHEILYLENSAREKEMEWNEILRKRKLKEEAYARLERKIHMIVYMENDGQLQMPSTKSSLASIDWENSGNTTPISREKSFGSKDDLSEERSSDSVAPKRERTAKTTSQQRTTPPKTNGESSRKQNEASSPDSRQIGEGRQGAIVDVRSIIADHRLKHPEAVPRRGRRMRNSVNIGLGAGGAMVETGHNADSRPSSTESCKSNPSTSDSMNYKDILMQFAKMSQQGEPVKVPQNYPDVTLHPVAPSSAGQNTASQPSGSLLHGILTKAQSPRSNTFSPTLARLLTAPERERNSPVTAAVASMSQQSATTHLQTYQGSNMVSINDLLSSSKARTEITITPVVNTPAQSHSNDLIQVEDADEEATMIDDRKGNLVGGRDNKQMAKDNPPSPSAPPKCQGCMTRPAQFVCAGCGNQWYCSRGCQLASWATHSDYCPPESENSKVKSNV